MAIPSAIIHNIMDKNIFPYTLGCTKICRENIFFRLEEAHSSEQKLVSLQKSNILLWRNHLLHLREYGIENVKIFRRWEKLECKIATFQNHRIFSLRCLKEDLIPVSIRLKSNITTPKAKQITRKAEKALLNKRIRNINNTITMATTERDTCINTLLEVFPKEIMEECKRFINLRREAYYMKVKMRQIAKLERLCHKNRGGCSNNKDGGQGRKDRTVPSLTTNNENNDGTVSNINNRWVVNLSGQPLTEAEYKV